MKLVLQRRKTEQDFMFGALTVDGAAFCLTLEDELRAEKIMNETAIPAGVYNVTLENSPKFGPDTLTLLDVPNFSHIRIHGGNSDEDTEGCILVGDRADYENGMISGAQARAVLAGLKQRVKLAIEHGDSVTIEIRNAPGDRFIDSGNLAIVV